MNFVIHYITVDLKETGYFYSHSNTNVPIKLNSIEQVFSGAKNNMKNKGA